MKNRIRNWLLKFLGCCPELNAHNVDTLMNVLSDHHDRLVDLEAGPPSDQRDGYPGEDD